MAKTVIMNSNGITYGDNTNNFPLNKIKTDPWGERQVVFFHGHAYTKQSKYDMGIQDAREIYTDDSLSGQSIGSISLKHRVILSEHLGNSNKKRTCCLSPIKINRYYVAKPLQLICNHNKFRFDNIRTGKNIVESYTTSFVASSPYIAGLKVPNFLRPL